MPRSLAEVAFAPEDLRRIKDKMLNWASRFGIFLFLDSNEYKDPYGAYECLLGAGAKQVFSCHAFEDFEALQKSIRACPDWLLGHCCYDLKNLLEPRLHSRHEPGLGWPLMQFFVPEVVCFIRRNEAMLVVESPGAEAALIANEILETSLAPPQELPHCSFQSRFTREAYLDCIATLREHIRQGDCYEITLCNEAFAEGVILEGIDAFRRLNESSPAPFAACYQNGPLRLFSASPERFLCKRQQTLFSQPIKGTARRGSRPEEDAQLKEALLQSTKERAENVMIADLVRNDLARSCVPGSVCAEELFGIYSFPKVHQMISTLSGRLRDDCDRLTALCQAFPMGSMTGAPKHMALQLIDRYERSRRELYSGSVGYFSPDGDFDFNVVIRSLSYHAEQRYLSFQSGGAITWGSHPESEWEEMRLKAAALEDLFAGPPPASPLL